MRSERQRSGERHAEDRPGPHRGLVLVVEDEEPLRELLGEALRRAHFRVEALRDDGEVEAWRARAERAPDLLLVDLHLPGADGRSLARRLGLVWPGLPVLLMSGLPDDEALADGALVLVKPFRLGELLRRVEALLARSPHR